VPRKRTGPHAGRSPRVAFAHPIDRRRVRSLHLHQARS
jgi:hypothetical protein